MHTRRRRIFLGLTVGLCQCSVTTMSSYATHDQDASPTSAATDAGFHYSFPPGVKPLPQDAAGSGVDGATATPPFAEDTLAAESAVAMDSWPEADTSAASADVSNIDGVVDSNATETAAVDAPTSAAFSLVYSVTGSRTPSATATGNVVAAALTPSDSTLIFQANTSYLMDYSGWSTLATTGCTDATDNEYYWFSITPTLGPITSIRVRFATSASSTGPTQWGLYDNGQSSSSLSLDDSGTSGGLGDVSLTNIHVSGALTFALYACGAKSTQGVFRLGSLQVDGTTASQ